MMTWAPICWVLGFVFYILAWEREFYLWEMGQDKIGDVAISNQHTLLRHDPWLFALSGVFL